MDKEYIIENFPQALKNNDICIYYHPQYNHATGRMIGAEALMRWHDDTYGWQSPLNFIPVLEETGLIYDADLFVFELICKFLKKCMDNGIEVVPISFNVSRHDMYNHDYVKDIEIIRAKYDIPVSFLRAEITESSAIGGMKLVSGAVEQMHKYGYIVEMDDFGSGYSSLNILKDLPVDVIKLDMRFLKGNMEGRGGAIINAIAQMSKWLHTPVIVEGVETPTQADYMTNIGCHYIQGYLYSKPVPEDDFLHLLQDNVLEKVVLSKEDKSMIDVYRFTEPDSMETEFFNKYAGPSVIFTYKDGDLFILRANRKYIDELGLNMTEKEFYHTDSWNFFGLENKKELEEQIESTIKSGKEVCFETCIELGSACCGNNKVYLRNFMSFMGMLHDQYVMYLMIRNITEEKTAYDSVKESEQKFRYASEHVGSYAWEYNFDTKEMRPCARCMRDLGLPPLVENYPEPVFESGLFPRDYEELYYDLLFRLANGEKYIEGIVPLTEDRIPFRICYTTVFDEAGKPLKAYGSATPVAL